MKKNVFENCSLEDAVRSVFGEDIGIVQMNRVAGGDINHAFCAKLSNGEKVFIKMNTAEHADFFRTELLGLTALDSTGKIGVPETFGWGIDRDKGTSFLLMEYLHSGPRKPDYWEVYGHELAMLHRASCGTWTKRTDGEGRYGFVEDNFIGASPQKNALSSRWSDFFREYRLLPQMQRADKYFDCTLRKKADRLLDRLDGLLREPQFPSLLHGDLWSGNMLCGPDGKVWIIDPAVYVGDFEADLAMTQLFGSLPDRFYDAYQEINPIDKSGYACRRDLYDLYHLLNHLNLFGRAYLPEVAEIIERFV